MKLLTKNGKVLIGSEGKALTSSNIITKSDLGLPVEIETNEKMQEVLTVDNLGKIYKYIGETNSTFTNGELYQIIKEEE